MKKIILIFILVLFNFIYYTVSIKAVNPNIQMFEGASIRTTGTQGLKFSASFSDDLLSQERGFFVIYGNAKVSHLESAIDSGSLLINGKTIKVVNGYNNTSSNLSVVLVGIPIKGYNQAITVVAYAKNDENYTFVPATVTRSITQVAINAARAGDGKAIASVLTDIESNYYKHGFNIFGDYEISSSIYEYDYNKIGVEFLSDFNVINDTSHTISDIYDAGELQYITFWQNDEMKEKWKWLAEFMYSLSTHSDAKSEWKAIINNENINKLSYSRQNLEGFLTRTKCSKYSEDGAIDFTKTEKYEGLKTYNDSIFINYSDYMFVKMGDKITIPNAPEKMGYEFIKYSNGVSSIYPGASHSITSPESLQPQYNPIQYTIKYFDQTTELVKLNEIYTVETSLNLKTYSKEGYAFEGWYDNYELTGYPVSSISQGTIGNKEFYAKTIKVDEKLISGVDLSINTKTYQVTTKANTYCIELKTDYNNIIITVTLNEGYYFGAEVNLVVNNNIVNKSSWMMDDDKLIYIFPDPNWTKPY